MARGKEIGHHFSGEPTPNQRLGDTEPTPNQRLGDASQGVGRQIESGRRKEDLHGVDEEGETNQYGRRTDLSRDLDVPKKRTKKFDPDTEAWATKTIKAAEPYVGNEHGARTMLRKINPTDRVDFDTALQAWVAIGDERQYFDLVKLATSNNWRRYLKKNNGPNLFAEGSREWFQEYQRTHRPVI